MSVPKFLAQVASEISGRGKGKNLRSRGATHLDTVTWLERGQAGWESLGRLNEFRLLNSFLLGFQTASTGAAWERGHCEQPVPDTTLNTGILGMKQSSFPWSDRGKDRMTSGEKEKWRAQATMGWKRGHYQVRLWVPSSPTSCHGRRVSEPYQETPTLPRRGTQTRPQTSHGAAMMETPSQQSAFLLRNPVPPSTSTHCLCISPDPQLRNMMHHWFPLSHHGDIDHCV